MKAYITYRPTYLNEGQGRYTLSYFLNQQYADYVNAGVTKIDDLIIPDDRFTSEVIPGVKNLRRFAVLESNGLPIDEFVANVVKIGATFDINTFATPAEAIVWIKANTSLVELSPGVFELSPEGIGMMGEVVPQKVLTIA